MAGCFPDSPGRSQSGRVGLGDTQLVPCYWLSTCHSPSTVPGPGQLLPPSRTRAVALAARQEALRCLDVADEHHWGQIFLLAFQTLGGRGVASGPRGKAWQEAGWGGPVPKGWVTAHGSAPSRGRRPLLVPFLSPLSLTPFPTTDFQVVPVQALCRNVRSLSDILLRRLVATSAPSPVGSPGGHLQSQGLFYTTPFRFSRSL